MNILLTPDQEFLVRRAIEAGRYGSREEAVQDALARWERQERERADLVAALDEADASIARGEGRPVTPEAMRELASGVKARGRTRLDPASTHVR